jgi:uncharacterized protein (DUF58 family)
VRTIAGLVLLGLTLLGLAAAQGWDLLYALAYGLLLLLLLARLWSWASVRWIYARPRPPLLRSQVGDVLDERVDLESLAWLPRPWLDLVDSGEHPEHNLSEVISLGPYGRRARRLRTRCRQRGEFRLGPVSLVGSDPFGLFRQERQLCPASRLIVLPATIPLPSGARLPGELSGGSLQGERVQFTTPNVSSVRDYQPGDSLNRVHWPSTARQGRLVVKEFERDPFSDIWVVLDLDRLIQAGSGPDSTEEYAVTAVASLVSHFLDQERAVGVLTQGTRLPPDRGPSQLLRALEFLAVARPLRPLEFLALARSSRPLPVDQLLLAEAHRFGRRDNLVVVTASTEGRWLEVGRDFRARGVSCSAVLIDGESFGGALPLEPVVGASLAAGLPTYVVRRGDDLALSLARPLNETISSIR